MASEVDVWLMDFVRGTEDPAGGLSRAFGVDRQTAQEIEQTLPRAVKKAIDPISAEQYAGVLREIGAVVEVRPAKANAVPVGARTLGSMVAARASGPPPAVIQRAHPSSSARSVPPRQAKGGERAPAVPGELIGNVTASRAPYAGLTTSMGGITQIVVGAGLLFAALTVRGTTFRGNADLLDVLLDWVATTLLTSGVVKVAYGFGKRREVPALRWAALLWIAILVGLSYSQGNVTME